jgi:hypothetical protein
MSTITTPVPRPAARRPWRLSGRTRKATLLVHLLAAGSWLGIDVVVAVLVGVGWFADDPAQRGAAYQALGWFVVWPMLTAGLVSLASGVVLGVGSKYGLLRYWWVAVKLVLNLVLCTLIVVALRPGMPEVVAHGQAIAAGAASDFDAALLFFPPAVSLVALTVATALAVFKPWGPRGARAPGSRGTAGPPPQR